MRLSPCGDDLAAHARTVAARGGAVGVRGRRTGPMVAAACALVACALILAGCRTNGDVTGSVGEPASPGDAFRTGQELRFTEVNPQGFRTWNNQIPAYRIGPGDKLKVKYFITRDMDEELTVSPDGTIAPRAVGQLRIEGMTLVSAQEMVRRASKTELADQKVVISLESPVSAKVYIGGMVERPGPYSLADMRGGTLQSVLLAGGFKDEARTGQVAIIRRGPDNMPMLKLVNVQEIIQTGFTLDDVPIIAGDIIYVPRSSISELNIWIDQFINRVVPFQSTFSYTLGTGGAIN